MIARLTLAVVFALSVLACTSDDAPEEKEPLTREELLDPETCKKCHDKHYTEWAASMHAYASKDPVFLAMNAQGQEETDGALGEFCVNCHAPMAVREDAFENGDFTDFEQVPDHLEGVTCYFCHNVVDVERDHNNGLVLADDTTMRGGVRNPVEPWAHEVAATEHFDRFSPESSRMCGSCHDIVVPGTGFHLERTFAEWKGSVFATSDDPTARLACIDCHMRAPDFDEPIAKYDVEPVPARPRHIHLWAAVDVPLTPNPGREALVSAVERRELPQSIATFTYTPLSVPGISNGFKIDLETEAGHRQPSGAAQDRRMWLEWIAYDESDEVIAESGTIDDDELEVDHDPDLWLMRDVIFSDEAKTQETHKFWEAVAGTQNTIPEATSSVPGAHTLPKDFTLPAGSMPKRIVFRVRMRPMGLDVLQGLVDAGYLDEAVMREMPTFTLHGATVEFPDAADPFTFTLTEDLTLVDENEHLCLLHPDSAHCD